MYTIPGRGPRLAGRSGSTVPDHPHFLQGKKKQGEHAGGTPANHPPHCSLHTCASSYRGSMEGWLGGLCDVLLALCVTDDRCFFRE